MPRKDKTGRLAPVEERVRNIKDVTSITKTSRERERERVQEGAHHSKRSQLSLAMQLEHGIWH